MIEITDRQLLSQSWKCLERSQRTLREAEQAVERAVFLRAFFMAMGDPKSLPSVRHGQPEQIRESLPAGGDGLSAGRAR